MRTLVKNRDAYRNFEHIDSYTGGLVLSGGEVKSLKSSQGSLQGAYLTLNKNKKDVPELFLKNTFIPPYQIKNTGSGYDPEQPRKVLVSKRELNALERELNNKGTTIIPIAIVLDGRFIKIQFATARGKKRFDKRQDLKSRAQKRDVERDIKGTQKVNFK